MLLNLAFGSPIKYEEEVNEHREQRQSTPSPRAKNYTTQKNQQFNTLSSPVAAEEDLQFEIRNMQNKQDMMRLYMQGIQNSIKSESVATDSENSQNLTTSQRAQLQNDIIYQENDAENKTYSGVSAQRQVSAANFGTFGGLSQQSNSQLTGRQIVSDTARMARGLFSENSAQFQENYLINKAEQQLFQASKNQLTTEVDILKFLLKPRILKISVHSQPFVAYNVLVSIKLLPGSYNTQDYFFEWKDIRTGKPHGFINMQWIKNVHSQAKNRFCIVGFPEADAFAALQSENSQTQLTQVTPAPEPLKQDAQFVYIHVECATLKNSEKYVQALTFLTQQQKDETIVQIHQSKQAFKRQI